MRKKTYKSFIVTLLISIGGVFVMILLPQISINESENEWEFVTNSQYNFTVEYPTKWVARTFDEHGSRGLDEVKLIISQPLLGNIDSNFQIAIFHQTAPNPTLEDVVAWGDIIIGRANHSLIEQGKEKYEKLPLQEGMIAGYPMLSRVYKRQEITNKDVYIARENDMIIIRLQSDAEDFELYLDDFERIVQSFRPLE